MRVHSINPPSPRRNEQRPDRLGSNGGQPARPPRDPDNPRFLLTFRFFDRTGYGKFARRSCRFEPMPSLRDGSDLRDLSVWTISLFSARPICVEFCRCTSPITIVGDRTARWGKQLHAVRRCLSGRKHVERSLRHLCWAGYTIFTALLHDKFLRPTTVSHGKASVICCASQAWVGFWVTSKWITRLRW